MEALLPLATLAGASGLMLWASRKERKDGFANSTLNPEYIKFLQSSKKKYNPLDALIDPINNPLLPRVYTSSQHNVANSAVQDSIQSLAASPRNTTYGLQQSRVTPISITNTNESDVLTKVKKCQTINTINCSAFDDPNFALDCGICHEKGKNSMGVATVGGLYVSEDSKEGAEIYAKRMNSRHTNYIPTVGTCAPNRFTMTKADCLRVQNQMECEAKQSFGTEGCSQCYKDGSFKYIESGTIKNPATLNVAGSGMLLIMKTNDENTKQVFTLSTTPQSISLNQFMEGDAVVLKVAPDTGSIAGFLAGTTVSGEFRLDISRLIEKDLTTNAKPRFAGFLQVGSDSYNLLRPGRNMSEMNLLLQNPFTFIDPTDSQALQCASTPFITKDKSAEFLNSSPCYKKGQAPGSYSLECVQDIFTSAGCTTEGTAYPSTLEQARALIENKTNGEFANKVYNASLMAYSGTNPDGSQLDLGDWNTVSKWCNGKEITSPCAIEGDGPHGAACLDYLWQNKGATDNSPRGIGPTYSGPSDAGCKRDGLLSPIYPNGKPNTTIINVWNSIGGGTSIANVKALMNQIHQSALDNSKQDTSRRVPLEQCYGIKFAEQATETVQVPQGADTSVLDSKPGRTQTPFIKRINYTWPSEYSKNAVYDLGPYGMVPWGFIPNFPNYNQRWIWGSPNANKIGYSDTKTYGLYTTYTNTTGAPITIGFSFLVTDTATILVNNKVILGPTKFIGGLAVSLPPGENLIQCNVTSSLSYAGFLGFGFIANTLQVIFKTDSSWGWTKL